MKSLILPGQLDSLSAIRQYVKEVAEQIGLDKKVSYHLQLAVDEIATNIIIHGYEQAGMIGEVMVQSEVNQDKLTITLEDSSAPFDPRQFGRPDQIDKPIKERPIGGLGVFMAMNNVDKFDYEYVNNRNRNIFIIKRVPDRAAHRVNSSVK
jgi:anti-sigma regulatory factor (Ser/Thr protein kinase)